MELEFNILGNSDDCSKPYDIILVEAVPELFENEQGQHR